MNSLQSLTLCRDLAHPNICKFQRLLRDDNVYGLVVEYIDGGSLKQLLQRGVSTLMKFNIALDIAKGMAWLHGRERAILHCDLKPDNILVTLEGVAKISDFGLSKFYHQSCNQKLILNGGTPCYMAPESLIENRGDTKTDVYSYGMILYEMFTGTRPFADVCDAKELKYRLNAQERPNLDLIPKFLQVKDRSHVEGLFQLIRDCWHNDPQLRPPFQEILERVYCVRLQYFIKDLTSCEFWQHCFEEKTKVSFQDFLEALINVLNLEGFNDQGNETVLNIACLKAVTEDPKTCGFVSIETFGHFVNIFGPFPRDSDGFVLMMSRIRNLLSNEMYHGILSLKETNDLLYHHKLSYLIRYSMNGSALTLSQNDGERILHSYIYPTSTGKAIDLSSIGENMKKNGWKICPNSPFKEIFNIQKHDYVDLREGQQRKLM